MGSIPEVLSPIDLTLPRIYILGPGNIGKLFAHSLARLHPRPPITLLVHRPEILAAFQSCNNSITIITNGTPNVVPDFDVELLTAQSTTPITNLLVTTKTIHTLAALTAVRHRLSSTSNIVFAQNGKGSTEEVTAALFSDPATRPAYLQTVIFHGIHTTGPCESVHAGVGHISISRPKKKLEQTAFLIDGIVRAPAIFASEISEEELLTLQLEKLMINLVVNPLSAIFRCFNGELVNLAPLVPLWKRVAWEATEVICRLEGVQGVKGVEESFEYEKLTEFVKRKAEMTYWNKSSMRQDVEAGRATEIMYINGWVVARGKELGLDMRVNEKAIECVERVQVVDINENAIREVFGKLE